MFDFTPQIFSYFERIKETIDQISRDDINTVMNILVSALEKQKQIFIMGNGGSAATASHFVCDFNKGLSYGKNKRFKFICLNDNVSTMMAYSNDEGYETVFVEPLKNFFNPGDIVIGISGSGNSPNVINAIDYANQNGGLTIGLCGYSGGKLKEKSNHSIHIPVNDMQISEDLHMVLDHLMMSILDRHLQ